MFRNLAALPLVALFACTFSYSDSSLAEASRPLIRPPLSIKPSQFQTPVSLSDVISSTSTKRLSGLDLESSKSSKMVVAQAKDYIELRRGQWPRARLTSWLHACEKNLGTKDANPFCAIEIERTSDSGGGAARSKAQARLDKRILSESIRAGDYAKAEAKSYPEVVAALGSIGDVQTILPIAKQVAQTKSCVSANVSTALGYKIEELFPDKDVIELAKKLYQKSQDCGKDLALATAAFRLGLIQIWQKNYAEIDTLMRKVESVPDAQPLHARAKYWRYQAAIVLNNPKFKAEAKETLLKDHPLSFQNLAANGDDAPMMDRVIGREMPNVFSRSLIRPDVNPVLRAAEALEKAGSGHLAAEVLDRNVTDLSTIEPEVRLYSAALLHRMGYSLTKFKILSSLFQDSPKLVTMATMELMYPLSYVDVVRAKQTSVDPLLFLSLMRQESAFNPDARSGVGARGLMQVMPATARTIRKVSKAQLSSPEINIEVGTKYFLKRLGQYNGDVELTLAAYNAGFGRVDQWIKRYPTDNKMLFLDFIPFRETRDYVSSILRNYYFYTRLYSPDTSAAVVLETGKINTGTPGRITAILAANAGDAARMTARITGGAAATFNAEMPRSPATSLTPGN